MKIKDSLVLITGANRGLGFAISGLIAQKGGFPILAGRNETALKQKCQIISDSGYLCDYFVLNMLDSNSIAETISAVFKKYGRLDILINNAGVVYQGFFIQQDIKNINNEFGTNILGVIELIKAVLPTMIKMRHGKIVNIASVNGQIPMPGEASYSATKAALIAFGNALREEIRDYKVTVFNVLPGIIDTDMAKGFDIPFLKQNPNEAAKEIVRGIERDTKKLICGRLNRIGVNYFPGITKFGLIKTSMKLFRKMPLA